MNTAHFSSEAVSLRGVSAQYRDVSVLKDINLTLPAGEILALLGPSGCGKSTLLRSIAGFVEHKGDIYVGDRAISGLSPHRRNIGMVFQDYALFPHMTVAENVGFGLRMRRVGRSTIAARISETLALVGLDGLETRMPRQLSGGQQQRVALARALIIRPAILLLDESLSALDKKLREKMRLELKHIQRTTGVTTIFVTHDQDEALGLADRLALMHQGRMLQIGTPDEVYRQPASPFVAEFLGAMNSRSAICRSMGADSVLLEIPGAGFLRSAAFPQRLREGDEVSIFVRPERIELISQGTRRPERSLPVTIAEQTYLGRHVEVALRLADGGIWTANVADEGSFGRLQVGSEATIEIDPRYLMVFPKSDGNVARADH